MAKVKIEELIDHLEVEMRRALSLAVAETLPDAVVDDRALFRAFLRAVRRKCSTWEAIPDKYVDTD